MRILVVGPGGRERSITRALAFERGVAVFALPGNESLKGIATLIDVPETDVPEIENAQVVAAARAHNINLVVIGPDKLLAAGLADELRNARGPWLHKGFAVLGPDKAGARLEWDKGFCTNVCTSAHVRIPKTRHYYDAASTKRWVRELGFKNIVIKAAWLCAGKGVIIPHSEKHADQKIDLLFSGGFGDPSLGVQLQQRLKKGVEITAKAMVSVVLHDGQWVLHVRFLGTASDKKRAHDGDRGPNTGGMISFSPSPYVTPELEEQMMEDIFWPVALELMRRKIEYRGVLNAGLMLTPANELYVLEFNARFGDPETQALIDRFTSANLHELFLAVANGEDTSGIHIDFSPQKSICLVLATEGYPDKSRGGDRISGLDKVHGASIIHAGTEMKDGYFVTKPGRALNIVARSDTWKEAATAVERAAQIVRWKGRWYRTDLQDIIKKFPKQN